MAEPELNKMFGKFGEIENIQIITERETGRPRGFGYVTMKTVEDANKIIKVADNFEFEGRKLVVQLAERSPRSSNTQATTSGVGYSGGYNKQRW